MIPKNPCEGCSYENKAIKNIKCKHPEHPNACLSIEKYQAELRGIRKGAYGVVDMIRTSNKLAGFKNRIEISNNIVIELREQGIERLDDD